MRYLLDAPHVLWDIPLDAGVEIGDGTAYPIPPDFPFAPSAAMTPLDDEAKKLTDETRKGKENWGRPEDNIPIAPQSHVGRFEAPSTINAQAQPIIPPPLEHLTRPNDMRPNEIGPRQNPLIDEALRKQNERMAAENDKKMAEAANKNAEQIARDRGATDSAAKPSAQERERRDLGQGPTPKPVAAPGQGPAKPPINKPAQKMADQPKTGHTPPAPPSKEVPRDTAGTVTPSSDNGDFSDKANKASEKK